MVIDSSGNADEDADLGDRADAGEDDAEPPSGPGEQPVPGQDLNRAEDQRATPRL